MQKTNPGKAIGAQISDADPMAMPFFPLAVPALISTETIRTLISEFSAQQHLQSICLLFNV